MHNAGTTGARFGCALLNICSEVDVAYFGDNAEGRSAEAVTGGEDVAHGSPKNGNETDVEHAMKAAKLAKEFINSQMAGYLLIPGSPEPFGGGFALS